MSFDAAMLTDQSHCCIEAVAAGSVQHIAVRKSKTVMIRCNRVLRHIRRLFAVIDLEHISVHLAFAHFLRYDDTGNALVVGLLGIEPIGVVIPCSLNEDLILSETVRPMRAAEPHQHLILWFLAFRCAADDALVDVKVLLVTVYMGVHELLQLRDNIHIRMFLLHRHHSNPMS